MAFKRRVSTTKVRIDNEDYSIKAGSFEYDDGFPERSVEGTEGTDIVYGEDPSTAIGMMKFELNSTVEDLDSIKKFQRGFHTIYAYEEESGWSRTMLRGVSMNDETKSTGSDGSFSITFKGDPLV